MKRTLAVLSMIAVGVFFCSSVFAASGPADPENVYTASYEANGCQMKVSAAQYGVIDGYSTNTQNQYVSFDGQSGCLLYVSLFNYTNSILVFNNVKVYLNINTTTGADINSVINYSQDLFAVYTDNNASIDIVASSDWAVGQTGIKVPANSSVTCIAEVKFSSFNGTGYAPKLIGVSIPVNPTVTSSSTYPNGTNQGIIDGLNTLHNDLQSSNSSAVSSDSNTLHDQSDSVHQQEATYYAQNSAAIQATGLSNYQFDSTAVSGLTGVRGDFIDVWNSLNGWNSVYIFSLTLGLALTILRHSPSAITSAIRRRKQNNE